MNKLVLPILFLIASVGLYFIYISPTADEIKEHQAKEAEFDKAFSEITEVKDILEELKSTYSGISQDNLVRLGTLLPSNIDFARVVQNIGGIVSSYGVPMEKIVIRNDAKEDDLEVGVRKHEINFVINTRYGEFMNIISDIETNIQLANVSSVRLESARSNEGNFLFTPTFYDITLTLYSFE